MIMDNAKLNCEHKLFLATTADLRYWGEESRILFLGEWCKIHSEKNKWIELESKTLQYHWDDRKKFEIDRKYISDIYENYIGKIAKYLNQINEVDYSERYWRILIGLWLRTFIDALFDRYCSIKAAANTGYVGNTWIPEEKLAPPSVSPSYTHEYNLNLYGSIIRRLAPFPFEEKQMESIEVEIRPSLQQIILANLSRIQKRTVSEIVVRILKITKKLILVKIYPILARALPAKISFAGYMYLSFWNLFRFQISLSEFPILFQGNDIKLMNSQPTKNKRKALEISKNASEFECILNEIIVDHIPMIYIENYHEMHTKVVKKCRQAPKIIVTSYSILNRQAFEFWSAYHIEVNGTKLFLAQHGGGYGSNKYMFLDEHVEKTFDGYYTWGAKFNGWSGIKKMPSLRLQTSKEVLRYSNPNGEIMWLAARYDRYKTLMDSGLSGPHMLRYIEEQKCFVDSLCSDVQSLLVRRYYNDAWEDKNLLKEVYPWLKIQNCKAEFNQYTQNTDLVHQLLKCRLLVATVNETTYLETLSANYPTIAYWNPSFYEIRDEAVVHFDQLVEVGILHYTPESAAAMVNRVFANPREWWESQGVQSARREFCAQLAYTSEDWLEIWKNELQHQRDNVSER